MHQIYSYNKYVCKDYSRIRNENFYVRLVIVSPFVYISLDWKRTLLNFSSVPRSLGNRDLPDSVQVTFNSLDPLTFTQQIRIFLKAKTSASCRPAIICLQISIPAVSKIECSAVLHPFSMFNLLVSGFSNSLLQQKTCMQTSLPYFGFLYVSPEAISFITNMMSKIFEATNNFYTINF